MFGILGLSFWGYVIATVVLTQITIAAVTLYLHRAQAHRALSLHPVISHFFRLWLWLTTGMVTGEWVAVHRKHHAFTDKEGDPHSPVVEGLGAILSQGAELYAKAASDKEMVTKYSKGTPDDWMERKVYIPLSRIGIFIMLAANLVLFGIPGITIWAIQMMWIPIWAAGVVNGVGHALGYRNYECADSSTNILPWGFIIGGEELHNNHHVYASSAKFSLKWWEFDLGWFYIRILSFLGLAKVRKLPPKLVREKGKAQVDINTVRAVIGNRFLVMQQYYKTVLCPILKREKRNANNTELRLFQRARRLFKRQEKQLSESATTRLQTLIAKYDDLRTAYNFRKSLQDIWLKTASSQKELIEELQQWCKQAEASGLDYLRQFAEQVKSYTAAQPA